MKSKRWLILIISIFMVIGLQSCNLPGAAIPTVFPYPSPDLTLTAIFSPVAPTATLPPLVQTATAMLQQGATSTPAGAVQPTQTSLVPLATNTTASEATPTQTPIVPPATNTAAPTQPPPAPTSTATRPAITPTARVNTELVAQRLNTPPTIDGNLSEWRLRGRAETAVYGQDRVRSEGDSSARFTVAWDKDYLYIAARVMDQKYVQNATGRNLYKGDSLEILLDRNLTGDYYDRELNSDDYQIGISPGSPAPGQNTEVYIWYPKKARGNAAEVVVAAKATGEGYDVEVAIPWELFDINPKAGQHYGFAFSVSDNDKKTGEDVQESLVSSVATRRLTDPTTWGDLELDRP